MASADAHSEERQGLRHLLRALRYRNFRLFFGGQLISVSGTWMQQVAMSWLVYRLTESAFFLGVVGFAGQLPTFLLTPFAGIVVDRFSRHRILIAAQALAMIQAIILAGLTLRHAIAPWQILALGVFLGIVNALDATTRQAFVVDLVEHKEDLGNAIALNSAMFNAARLVGPAMAGLLIPTVGEGICFLLNGVSYIAVIVALLAMRIQHRQASHSNSGLLAGLKEGFAYAFGFPPIRAVVLLLGWVSLVGTPYFILMPIIARDMLDGNAATLGFLTAASGVGALASALYLAWRRSVLGFGHLIAWSAAFFGLGLMLLAAAHTLWAAMLLSLLIGAALMLQMAASNTILQVIVPDNMRGRVMSIYIMAFLGTSPLGSLAAGGLAARIGVPDTLLVSGALCALAAVPFARALPILRDMVHPIYIQIGILPEEAMGVRSAAQVALTCEGQECE